MLRDSNPGGMNLEVSPTAFGDVLFFPRLTFMTYVFNDLAYRFYKRVSKCYFQDRKSSGKLLLPFSVYKW